MELERNQPSIISHIFTMIKDEAKIFESKTGEVEFLISNELIEKAIAEAELFMELEKHLTLRFNVLIDMVKLQLQHRGILKTIFQAGHGMVMKESQLSLMCSLMQKKSSYS